MKFIVSAIVVFLKSLIGAILGPIGTLISNFLPNSLTDLIQYVYAFLDWLLAFCQWALSWLPFTATFWSLVGAYFIFRLSVPILVHSIKLVVKWWHALVP